VFTVAFLVLFFQSSASRCAYDRSLFAVINIVPRLAPLMPVLPSDLSAGYVALNLSALTYSAYEPRSDRLRWSASIPQLTSGGAAFSLDEFTGVLSVANT